MRYIPVTITQANLSWAINENIRRIEAVLATKARVALSLPMQNIDAEGNRIKESLPDDDTDACTLNRFLELQNG